MKVIREPQTNIFMLSSLPNKLIAKIKIKIMYQELVVTLSSSRQILQIVLLRLVSFMIAPLLQTLGLLDVQILIQTQFQTNFTRETSTVDLLVCLFSSLSFKKQGLDFQLKIEIVFLCRKSLISLLSLHLWNQYKIEHQLLSIKSLRMLAKLLWTLTRMRIKYSKQISWRKP